MHILPDWDIPGNHPTFGLCHENHLSKLHDTVNCELNGDFKQPVSVTIACCLKTKIIDLTMYLVKDCLNWLLILGHGRMSLILQL